MARLFFNISPFTANTICQIADQICQSRFKSMPNTNENIKILPKSFKVLPKWRTFAKSGHTGWDVLVSDGLAVDDHPQASLLSASFDVSDDKVITRDVLVTSRRWKFSQVDIVEGVAKAGLVEGRLELVAVTEIWRQFQRDVQTNNGCWYSINAHSDKTQATADSASDSILTQRDFLSLWQCNCTLHAAASNSAVVDVIKLFLEEI